MSIPGWQARCHFPPQHSILRAAVPISWPFSQSQRKTGSAEEHKFALSEQSEFSKSMRCGSLPSPDFNDFPKRRVGHRRPAAMLLLSRPSADGENPSPQATRPQSYFFSFGSQRAAIRSPGASPWARAAMQQPATMSIPGWQARCHFPPCYSFRALQRTARITTRRRRGRKVTSPPSGAGRVRIFPAGQELPIRVIVNA